MHLFHLFLFVMEKDWIRWKSAKKIISTREWCAEHPLLVKTHNTDFLNLQHSGKVILSFVLATNPKITIYYIKNVFFQEPKMSSETLNYKKIISKFLCKKCHWNEEILSYQGQQLLPKHHPWSFESNPSRITGRQFTSNTSSCFRRK